MSDEPLSINFVRFKRGRRVSIPLQFFNGEGSPGIKRGGFINYIHREVPCLVYSDSIPKSIPVDLTGLQVGARIKLSSLDIPMELTPSIDHDAIVATVAGKRGIRGDDSSGPETV